MKKLYLLLISLLVSISTQACSTNTQDYTPSKVVQNAFKKKFSLTHDLEWEPYGNYSKAEFKIGFKDYSAWFTNTGEWTMTKYEISYSSLPKSVQQAFQTSKYFNWHWEKDDDFFILERINREKNYLIEVESGNLEMTLYFDEKGTLLKEVTNSDNGTQVALADFAKTYLDNTFKNYIVTEINQKEGGFLEIEILQENTSKEVLFSYAGNWIQTKQDVFPHQIPKNILNVINQKYAGYIIDDADLYQTSDSLNYFLIEIEKKGIIDSEIMVKIDNNGNILSAVNKR